MINAIKFNPERAEELSKIATDAVDKVGLENVSEELADLLHDCVDFSENPTVTDLTKQRKF